MTQRLHRHRRAVVTLAMLAVFVQLVLDGLALLGMRPPTGQSQMLNLLLFGVLAAVLPRDQPAAAPNWFARHRVGVSVALLAFLLGAAWTGAAFGRAGHTSLASQRISDLLYLLAFGFWFRDSGRPTGLIPSNRTT